MKLYHYTGVTLATAIFNSDLKGSAYTTQGRQKVGPAVWLTSSAASEGHGLLTGNPLTDDEFAQQVAIGNTPKNRHTHVKTAIRLCLDSSQLQPWSLVDGVASGLIDYVRLSRDFLGEDELWRKYMGMSCYVDPHTATPEQVLHDFQHMVTQESTWWLHFGSINPNLIEEVAFQTEEGFVPYDFELHGREVFVHNGLEVVSPELLAEFRLFYPPQNRFDAPHAAVFCEGKDARPLVLFQAIGKAWGIDLQTLTASARVGELPENIDLAIDWTQRHQEDLMRLWPAAVASYKRFYP